MNTTLRTGRRRLLAQSGGAALAVIGLPGAVTHTAAAQEATPAQDQETTMPIVEPPVETSTAPSEGFTGMAYVDTIAIPSEQTRLSAGSVHFMPGSRTAWHTHPKGQWIYVTEGVGLAQRRGEPVAVIHPGDRVFFRPEEEHWHGAALDRFMTHLSMLEVDAEGNGVIWGTHVSDEEYGQQAIG